jgi:uncharacterized protein (DUF305 family)
MLKRIIEMRFVLGLVVFACLALLIAACGGDDEKSGGSNGNATEQAFLEGMVPHHESAVAMARLANDRAEHDEVRHLAEDIISAQNSEIRQMQGLHRRLFGSALKPDPAAHEKLGVEAHEAGMDSDLRELRNAKPFDQAFIDMMIPHHQGAIRQARAVLAKAEDAELRRLAAAIVSAQSREIRQMNEWRTQWYGSESPSGGVPSATGDRATSEGATGTTNGATGTTGAEHETEEGH